MRLDILTLFPDFFQSPLDSSILKRALKTGALEVVIHNIRQFSTDKHQSVDDTPYGGGPGMLLRVDILDTAIQSVKADLYRQTAQKPRTILLTPQGVTLKQATAKRLAGFSNLILICGHYEGFDERIRNLVDEELSIGEYILTGGEIAALAVLDAVSRLIPGVITEGSPEEESFSLLDENANPLLEYPQYTRPVEYRGEKVPEILLSGNHAAIAKWRFKQAKIRSESRQNAEL
jgi:tRNA (guanine37-N1)-methyltransferase